MRNELTAVVERDEDWFVAYAPEVPGANGQGRTRDEALESLADAIGLILQDRREPGQGDYTAERHGFLTDSPLDALFEEARRLDRAR